jgi:uncharacterized membrane protein
MDIYLLVKFLHIASAIVWIGAGVGMVVLGAAAYRQSDREEFVRVVRNVAFLAPRVFVPISLATLVFGLIAAFMQWGFTELWVWIGLFGFAATFVTGNFLLGPRAGRVKAIIAREGVSDDAVSVGHELLQLSKFDYAMLFVVVADMVFKPVASDWPVLLLMALALAAAGVVFLAPVLRPRPAAA